MDNQENSQTSNIYQNDLAVSRTFNLWSARLADDVELRSEERGTMKSRRDLHPCLCYTNGDNHLKGTSVYQRILVYWDRT